LESVCRGNSTVGSNPTLSARPPLRRTLRSFGWQAILRAKAIRRSLGEGGPPTAWIENLARPLNVPPADSSTADDCLRFSRRDMWAGSLQLFPGHGRATEAVRLPAAEPSRLGPNIRRS